MTFINAIPKNYMEEICTWLDSIDVIFFEGQMNLKWDKLLKDIRADPHDFIYEQNGWKSFVDNDEEHPDGEDEESEGDSEFDSADVKEVTSHFTKHFFLT